MKFTPIRCEMQYYLNKLNKFIFESYNNNLVSYCFSVYAKTLTELWVEPSELFENTNENQEKQH